MARGTALNLPYGMKKNLLICILGFEKPLFYGFVKWITSHLICYRACLVPVHTISCNWETWLLSISGANKQPEKSPHLR